MVHGEVLRGNRLGTPPSLTFYSHCGQGVMASVTEVFPNVEHRECM
jgi:hypothetical protein